MFMWPVQPCTSLTVSLKLLSLSLPKTKRPSQRTLGPYFAD